MPRARATSSGSSSPSEQAPPQDGSSEARARIRRQQVRRAQIQHRQRQADYIRELEQSVALAREEITVAADEVEGLRSANESLRAILRVYSAYSGSAACLPVSTYTCPWGTDETSMPMAAGFTVSSAPTDPSFTATSFDPMHFAVSGPGFEPQRRGFVLPQMTPEQTELVINFILA